MKRLILPISFALILTSCAFAEEGVAGAFDSLQTHDGSVFDLVFTPDGMTLVSVGADHKLHFNHVVSDEASRKEKNRRRRLFAELDSSRFEVRQHAFQELAELGEEAFEDIPRSAVEMPSQEVRLRKKWLAILTMAPRGEGHREEVRGVAVSANGEIVASASRDNMIGLWSVNSGRAISAIRGHSDGVWCVGFAPNGTRLVSGGGDHVVRIWDTKKLAATHEFIGHESTVHDVKFSNDGTFVASAGGFDHSVRVWSVEHKKNLHCFEGHADAVVCVDIAPDDQTIVSGDYDGSICLWDLGSGKRKHSFPAHRGVVRDVMFLPGNSQHLVSVGDDGVVKRWDLKELESEQVLAQYHGGLCRIAFPPDNKSFVVGGRDGRIRRVQLHD